MDDATTVRALLDAAGFDPPADDVAKLVKGYERVKMMSAFLYSVEEARYESPALRFETEPRFADWW